MSNLRPSSDSIVLFTDTHYRLTNPPYRKDHYAETLALKTFEVLSFARKWNLPVFHLGDLVHQRDVRLSWKVVSYIYSIYQDFQTVYLIPGNHDIPKAQSIGSSKTQLTGFLMNLGLFKSEEFVQVGELDIYCLPFGGEVPTPKVKSNYNLLLIHDDPVNLAGHASFNLFDKVIYGHMHVEENLDGRVSGLAPTGRVSISERDIVPSFYIFNQQELVSVPYETRGLFDETTYSRVKAHANFDEVFTAFLQEAGSAGALSDMVKRVKGTISNRQFILFTDFLKAAEAEIEGSFNG